MKDSIHFINFDDWDIWEGASEGGGRSEKEWIQSKDGQIGLFKYPKSDYTTEFFSEYLAYKLGEYLDIPTAKIDIGIRADRLGCISYLINGEDESIVEGVNFLMGIHPNYNSDTMYDVQTKKYYCMDFLFEPFEKNESIKVCLVQMMIFDFLIGNSDRHQNNWAILRVYEENGSNYRECECPLYDNGSSLCCYEEEERIREYLTTKDMTRFSALVDSKSKSMIRIDGNIKKRPTHREVVKYLLENYSKYAKTVVERFLTRLNETSIEELVNKNSQEIISNERKELIIRYLKKKVEILREVYDECKSTV